MRLATLLTLLALAVSFCHAQPADEPKEEDEVQQPDIPTILSYPRTIDTMARFWMVLFQACQDAGVKAHTIPVAYREGPGNVIPSQLQLTLRSLYRLDYLSPEDGINLLAVPADFAKLVEALVPHAGTPHLGFETQAAYAVFCYPRGWPGTPTVESFARGAVHQGGIPAGGMSADTGMSASSRTVHIVIYTIWRGMPPQPVYDLLKKFPPGQ